MKITATNGNARNGIKGQRVTFTTRRGCKIACAGPVGNALKRPVYWPAIESRAQFAYAVEIGQGLPRFYPAGHPVLKMVALFAASKARLSIRHGRRFP